MKTKDQLIAHTILDIIRTANQLERLGGQYAKEADLVSVQQYMILSMLQTEDSLSMSELRDNTLVTKQAITGLVERMKKRGFVEARRDMQDKRVTRVHLTEEGKQALAMIRPKRVEGNREAFSVLNDEEINQLASIISKLTNHLHPP